MMAADVIQPSRSLGALLAGMAAPAAADDRPVTGLAVDSRAVRPGDLFLACPGRRARGHEYIADAIGNGAVAALYDSALPQEALNRCRPLAARRGVALVGVTDLAMRIGEIAARFHEHPSRDLFAVGVTGTNGKTSCSHYLAQALSRDGPPCGVIGTLGYGPYGALAPAGLTTPDALTLQAALADLRGGGARHVVLEASSHGLAQGRLAGVSFDVALFTNLTRDHLDYHADMQDYAAAKARLFAAPGLGHAVINGDDAFGRELLERLPAAVQALVYGLEGGQAARAGAHRGAAVVRGEGLRLDRAGLEMSVRTPWGEGRLRSPLMGRFNAANLLGVVSVLLAMGVSADEALNRLAGVRTVPGRMERFGGRGGRPLAVVDYAHTPDALEQALTALRGHTAGKLWCVFGCGGDRDPGKRPQMGGVAVQFADRVVLTDDNPRGEHGAAIIQQIRAGMRDPAKAVVIHDRAAAIAHAIDRAGEDDVVLVAGKGHEEYQLVGSQRRPFSDRRVVSDTLGEAL